jgi:hypothetical protein
VPDFIDTFSTPPALLCSRCQQELLRYESLSTELQSAEPDSLLEF